MKATSNWGNIKASNGGGELLPEGGYACRIDSVHDHTDEKTPYLEVVYNPYIMDEQRFYFGKDAQDWQHSARFYLNSDFGWSRYKMLVECVEQSEGNGGFKYDASRDGAEQTLAGKWVGFVIRHRLYTKKKGKRAGEDGTQLDIQHISTVQAIKEGDFPAPKTKDDRDRGAGRDAPEPELPPVDVYDDDIPFE